MTITLESIQAELANLAKLVAAFEKQQKTSELFFPEVTIPLAPGEHYAGIITGKEGESSYHLVLLPGQATHVTWENATEWAAKQGGEHVSGGLPTRREQALLYANLKEEFEELYYWSCEVRESESASDCAWYQDFCRGHQRCCDRDDQLRARAVRRVFVK